MRMKNKCKRYFHESGYGFHDPHWFAKNFQANDRLSKTETGSSGNERIRVSRSRALKTRRDKGLMKIYCPQ